MLLRNEATKGPAPKVFHLHHKPVSDKLISVMMPFHSGFGDVYRCLDCCSDATWYAAPVNLGDDIRNVEASLAAGMEPVIARYGYLGNGHPPESWGARYLIDHPRELLAYL